MHYLGALTDVLHALFMIIWILGLPLLFWHKYPNVSKTYFWYALIFIFINQLSHYILGQCVLTSIAHYFYSKGDSANTSEWFSVRFAYFVFGLTPSHRGIKIVTEVLIVIAVIGGFYSMYRKNKPINN